MKLSMSNNAWFMISDEDAIREFSNVGFDCIDFRMTDRSIIKDKDRFLCRLSEKKKVADESGIEIRQAHGPYASIFDKEDDTNSLFEAQSLAIHGADQNGISYMVLHPCIFSWCYDDVRREEAFEKNLKWFKRFIPEIRDRRIKVLIENCYIDDFKNNICRGTSLSTADELTCIIDELNRLSGRECFGICLDTGHCNCSGGTPHIMAEKLGKRIKALHVHDNDKHNDYHMIPYGIKNGIDFEKFFTVLAATGYKGTLNFELDAQIERKYPCLVKKSLDYIYSVGRELSKMFDNAQKDCNNQENYYV